MSVVRPWQRLPPLFSPWDCSVSQGPSSTVVLPAATSPPLRSPSRERTRSIVLLAGGLTLSTALHGPSARRPLFTGDTSLPPLPVRGTFLYPAAKLWPRHLCRLPLSTTGDERRCERLSPTTLDGCHWAATSFRPPSRRPTPLPGTSVPALQTSSRPFNIEKHKLLTSVVLKQQRGFRPPLYPGCLKWHLPVCSSSALHLGLANLPGWFVRVMGRSSAVL